MSKEIYISSTPHETRLAIVENDALTEIYYERENEYTLAGSIYNGKVTRVLPGMQSSFVDIGLERDAFLYITDFMEEAGDSADFDTSGNGEGRAPRRESRDRGERPNREAAALPAPEGSAQVATEEAAPRSDRDRGDRGGRSERGGRGRRDRGRGNRDRNPRPDRTELPRDSAPRDAAPASFDTPPAELSHEPEFPEVAALPDRLDADLGEASPGADGSRRWRGRRGRRRGRGPGQADASPESTASPLNETAGDSSDTAPSNDFESDAEPESGFEFDSAAATPIPALPRNTAPIASAYGEPSSQVEESRSRRPDSRPDQRPGEPRRDRDRGRGDRGGRNRDRGGRGDNRGPRTDDRGPRNDAGSSRDASTPRVDDRGPRSDRGPRTDDRGPRVPRGFAPKTDLYGVEATPAYGEAPAAPAGEPIILPGESLSKYRKGDDAPAAKPTPAAENIIIPAASSFTVSSDWDGGATLPGETLSRHRRPDSGPSSSRQESRRPEPRRESSAQHRTDNPVHSRNEAPVAPAQVVPVEYEPTEASASYRVDPISQTAFLQSAPVLEPEPVAATPEDVWDWQKPATPPATESAPETIPAHDVTQLQPTGEMLSATPAIEPPSSVPMQEVAAPADPIQHEAAVVESVTPESAFIAHPPAHVEEELIDEEIDTLHASSIEEMDDFDEEETLEGAADLGTMIREMSIDEITRPADVETDEDSDEEEYDDFEEEDSVDDNLGDDLEDSSSDEEPDSFNNQDSFTHDVFAPAAELEPSTGLDYIATPASPVRDGDRGRPRRDGGRRDGRRDGRNRDGRGGRDRDRSRSTGGAGDRERSGRSRQSMQSTNLPAISDLLKPGQEVLVQIAKEPIAKKGARITSHIALPGRFLVFMPTVNHTGVSRKIESDGERRRLKEILLSEKGEASGGFIVRTAAAGATEEELRSDLRFLLNLWADIKTRSESSKSPALIYHDLNLVERILRDQVTDTFSAIWVDTEADYERILRFLQRFQPSLIRRVKLYTKEVPLFEQFGITEEINKALRSKVWLKSGGSIVINQTEALVAIDINTGKFVGKTARLEDTIVKTNLDAIPEIVRQIRLRDLGGIIIIDFIDMDERKNRNRVMAALEDELKNDRAPSKVLQFNDFGLVAITRKRVKQSLERTLSTTCNVCVGTGMTKSPITICNDIYIEMRKMHRHLDRGDVMLRVHPEVVKALKSPTARWLQEMEEMVGKTILVKSDPALHPEQFDIH